MFKDDSRKVKKGDTFVANTNGIKYITDAINNGASSIIIEDNTDNYYNSIMNKLDYNFNFKLIGVTGTNGKTTTCYTLYKMLSKLNYKCAYIGTLGFYKDDYYEELYNTTPSMLTLYNLLLQCNDCDYVVMEVSSIGLIQNRLGNLKFDYAVFTNLTHDHLDFHKTMDEYAKAKQQLFYRLKENGKCLVNNDDSYSDYFKIGDYYTYGSSKSDFNILNYNYDNYMNINIEYKDNIYNFKTKLIGKFNVYNLTCVIGILLLEGNSYKNIYNNLITIDNPKGRMQRINNVFIDYAHTPDAVLNAIDTVKELNYKIITILGCGGNRDISKRKEMGSIASYNSDYCIFTSDNPRFEDELSIVRDMLEDVKNNYEVEIDREKAIEKGFSMLDSNTILLILGKGHEEYQVIKDIKYHFSDHETVNKLYKNYTTTYTKHK